MKIRAGIMATLRAMMLTQASTAAMRLELSGLTRIPEADPAPTGPYQKSSVGPGEPLTSARKFMAPWLMLEMSPIILPSLFRSYRKTRLRPEAGRRQ